MACSHTNISVLSSAWPTVYVPTTVSLLLKTASRSSLGGSPMRYLTRNACCPNVNITYIDQLAITILYIGRLRVPMYNIYMHICRCDACSLMCRGYNNIYICHFLCKRVLLGSAVVHLGPHFSVFICQCRPHFRCKMAAIRRPYHCTKGGSLQPC